MGRVKKQRREERRRSRQRPEPAAAERSGGGAWLQGRLTAKRPVFRFVALFVVFMALYYAFSATPVFNDIVFPAYLQATAAVSVGLLNLFGEEARLVDVAVVSPKFAVEIKRGCDAVEPSALFVAAILAWPVAFRFRALGILVGVPCLLTVNLLRIVSLYYTGVFFPDAFHTMHVEVWQPVFILLSLALWILWVVWTVRRMARADGA